MRKVWLFVALCCLMVEGARILSGCENEVMAEKKGWKVYGPAGAEDLVEVLVGLKLRNADRLEQLLLDVSDPASTRYGLYLSQKEVYRLTSPPVAAVNRVLQWLGSVKPLSTSVRNNGGFVAASMTVSQASLLLHQAETSTFYRFQHVRDSQRFLTRSTRPIVLPEDIYDLIQLIDGVNRFPYLRLRSLREASVNASSVFYTVFEGDSNASVQVHVDGSLFSSARVTVTQGLAQQQSVVPVPAGGRQTVTATFDSLANYVNIGLAVEVLTRSGTWLLAPAPNDYPVFPSPWVTPAVANSMYFIPPGTRSTNPSNSQAVAEFDEQYFSRQDLKDFSSLMGVSSPNVTVRGTNKPIPRAESTLDIEWITAIGRDVPTVFFSVEKGFLLEWAIMVSEEKNPPFVHSISYGEPEYMVPAEEALRVNQEFQLLGMRGLTIVTASGDLGSSNGLTCTQDVPDFPSSSPWVTSLGATFIARASNSPICQQQSVGGLAILCDTTVELPCATDAGSGFTTGGAFSNLFLRPSYQNSAVQAYLNSATLPVNFFNQTGRGYNDVAALGYHILIYEGGRNVAITGTSASAPIFAGIVSLLNDVQLNRGKPSLGFINPWMYQIASNGSMPFHQILSGNNRCRDADGPCCEEGFVAQSGWNPLTGLGTPIYPNLKNALP